MIGTIEPYRLIRKPGELAQQASGLDPAAAGWWVGAALGLLVLGLIAWRLNARLHRTPAQRAFLRVSRRLGFAPTDRSALRALASDAGVDPVALVLSPGACAEALRASGATAQDRERVSRTLAASAASVEYRG